MTYAAVDICIYKVLRVALICLEVADVTGVDSGPEHDPSTCPSLGAFSLFLSLLETANFSPSPSVSGTNNSRVIVYNAPVLLRQCVVFLVSSNQLRSLDPHDICTVKRTPANVDIPQNIFTGLIVFLLDSKRKNYTNTT